MQAAGWNRAPGVAPGRQVRAAAVGPRRRPPCPGSFLEVFNGRLFSYSRIVYTHNCSHISKSKPPYRIPWFVLCLAGLFDFNMSVFLKIDFFSHFFFNQIYCNIRYSTISIKDKLLTQCHCFFPSREKGCRARGQRRRAPVLREAAGVGVRPQHAHVRPRGPHERRCSLAFGPLQPGLVSSLLRGRPSGPSLSSRASAGRLGVQRSPGGRARADSGSSV